MQYLKLAALILASSVISQSQAAMSIKERFVYNKDQAISTVTDFKDKAVQKVSAWMSLLGGTTHEDQLKRLDYYLRLKNFIQTRRFLKKWDMYIKRWYVWIIDGRMPVKYPDGHISDQTFLNYVIAVEELMKGEPLTQLEREAACNKALEDVAQYRKAKGITL